MKRGLHKIIITSFAIMTALVFHSCRTTKYVPEDKYLIDHVHINCDAKDVKRDDLDDYIRQLPNIRLLSLWRLNLGIYNLSGTRDTRFNNWLRTIGSEPVIYNDSLAQISSNQLRMYMQSRGYYDAKVSYTMKPRRKPKRCNVEYTIESGELYRIKSIEYTIADENVEPLILQDTINTLLHVGDAFDANVHDAERARIAHNMQQQGYYHFDKNYVSFLADTLGLNHYVYDNLLLRYDDKINLYKKSVIDSVQYVISQSNTPPTSLNDSNLQVTYAPDPIFHKSPLPFRANLLQHQNFVRSNNIYNINDVEYTQQRFSSLPLFAANSIRFYDIDSITTADSVRHIGCTIRLTTAPQQQYGVDIEGTNSSGNLGGAIALRYRHLNIFKGAEVFNIKTRLSTQNQFAADGKERFFTIEAGVEASLTIPKFLWPFATERFDRKHNPSTIYNLSYDYQRRPDFTRTVFASNYTYNWRSGRFVRHQLTMIEFNIVDIPYISQNFLNYISQSYLQYSYQKHFILSLNYSYTLNQQVQKKNSNAWYFHFDIETAGNLLNALTKKKPTDEDGKTIGGIRFSQYIRTNVEARYQIVDRLENRLVYRLFGGIGVPYGNSRALPFEKSFFVGGANSIRAWPVRGLGPGSRKSDPNLRYHNQTADIRIEANAEYRFPIIGDFEGAAFIDAGNIWALKRSTNDQQAIFTSKFYEQIALSSGVGLRLNFDYFVIRFDVGVKVHDPAADPGLKWIGSQRFNSNYVGYNFAIGYPF